MEELQARGTAVATAQGGRPSKLTPDVTERLCGLLSVGATRKDAATLSGISYETFRRWMSRGGQDVQDAVRADADVSSDHGVFHMAILKAEATMSVRLVKVIYDAALNDPWLALAWLERRRPAEWGRNRVTSDSVLRRLSTDQLLDLLERLDDAEC